MSAREEEQGANKLATVKIIETVYIEAGTADDFKSVVQRLTGRDGMSSITAAPERYRAPKAENDRRAGTSDVKRSS